MNFRIKNRKGQAMVLVTIIIGTIMATVGAVAGFLTYYELRQANDAEKSAMAFYAADAGIEDTLFCYFTFPGAEGLEEACELGRDGGVPALMLSNNASALTNLDCLNADNEPISCGDNESVIGFKVKAFGSTQDTERVLETLFATKRNL